MEFLIGAVLIVLIGVALLALVGKVSQNSKKIKELGKEIKS